MKKIYLRSVIAVLIVATIVVVALSACKKEPSEDVTTTSSTVATTLATTLPVVSDTTAQIITDTTQPIPTAADTTAAPTVAPTTQAPTTTEPTTLSAEQIQANNIAAMCNAVNAVKGMKNFSAVKVQKVSFEITQCSASIVIPAANRIISALAHDNTKNYTFTDGVSPNPKNGEPPVTPDEAIPPTSKPLTLDPAGLKSLEVTTEGNNTVYTAVIAEETATLDNQVPYYHAMALDYLDIAGADLTGATIKSANITYHDATVIVSVDNTTGQLSGFRQITPITAVGEVTVIGVPADGTIEGNLDESWSFTW